MEHTEVHEFSHALLRFDRNKISTISEHDDAGGTFQYEKMDPSGAVIQSTPPLIQICQKRGTSSDILSEFLCL